MPRSTPSPRVPRAALVGALLGCAILLPAPTAAPSSTASSPAVSAASLPKLRDSRNSDTRRSPDAIPCSTCQVPSLLPSSTYSTRPRTPCSRSSSSSTAAMRGCSRGSASASFHAATTIVRRSADMPPS